MKLWNHEYLKSIYGDCTKYLLSFHCIILSISSEQVPLLNPPELKQKGIFQYLLVAGNELDKHIVALLQFVHFCLLDKLSNREHTNSEYRLTGNFALRKVR